MFEFRAQNILIKKARENSNIALEAFNSTRFLVGLYFFRQKPQNSSGNTFSSRYHLAPEDVADL